MGRLFSGFRIKRPSRRKVAANTFSLAHSRHVCWRLKRALEKKHEAVNCQEYDDYHAAGNSQWPMQTTGMVAFFSHGASPLATSVF